MFNIEFLFSFFPYVLPENEISEILPDINEDFASNKIEDQTIGGISLAGSAEYPDFSGTIDDDSFNMVPKLRNNDLNQTSDNFTDSQE